MSEDYEAELRRNRREKDEFFGEHPQSPIPPEKRDGFEGLNYFEPDPDYRVEATVRTHAEPEPVVMETTAGPEVRYLRVATFAFELGGDGDTASHSDLNDETYELGAYRQETGESEGLFVPFRDKTTGQGTYRQGRYMELEPEGDLADGEVVTLDFNLAYNPFCAYSETFSCPLPPEENWLETTVKAGERKPPF